MFHKMTERTGARPTRADRADRRAKESADAIAAATLRQLTRAYGPDAVGASILAAVKNGATSPADIAAAASSGTASARSQAGHLNRTERRDLERAEQAYGVAGQPREGRGDAVARLVGQRFGQVARLAASAAMSAELPDFGKVTMGTRQALTIRHRCQAMADNLWAPAVDRIGTDGPNMVPLSARETVDALAFLAALLADGPIAKADHDPATCAWQACPRCRRFRDGSDFGPLATVERRGRRQAPADVRPPNERTGARSVEILSEASLIRSADMFRNFHASSVSGMSAATVDAGPSPAVLLADSFCLPSVGRRGYVIDRPASAVGTRHGQAMAWRALLAAAGATVADRFGWSAAMLKRAAERDASPVRPADVLAAFAMVHATDAPADAWQAPVWRQYRRQVANRAPALVRRPVDLDSVAAYGRPPVAKLPARLASARRYRAGRDRATAMLKAGRAAAIDSGTTSRVDRARLAMWPTMGARPLSEDPVMSAAADSAGDVRAMVGHLLAMA